MRESLTWHGPFRCACTPPSATIFFQSATNWNAKKQHLLSHDQTAHHSGDAPTFGFSAVPTIVTSVTLLPSYTRSRTLSLSDQNDIGHPSLPVLWPMRHTPVNRLRTPPPFRPIPSRRDDEYLADQHFFPSKLVRQNIPAQIEHHFQYLTDGVIKMINVATRERYVVDCSQQEIKASLVQLISQSSPILAAKEINLPICQRTVSDCIKAITTVTAWKRISVTEIYHWLIYWGTEKQLWKFTIDCLIGKKGYWLW